ncbi:metal ABC transporter substrate-binding protein [Microaceticoccus formicicus]|uniref:metal ABC transporter substrate-binding protein n=1 Tax=Microaceticoccus formicicus TaxID=3118105 RepID=UPI003CD044B0|nr:metal ABC transporter substrate-binding protein [Peptoniphilaceae bacterium AMB_02]
MKVFKLLFLVLAMGLLSACSTNTVDKSPLENKLTVYSSIYPVWDFTSKVGGDKIDNKLLVPMGTEAHDWEPSPTDIAALEKADVLVINGLGMEFWANSVLGSLSNKNLTLIDTSKEANLIEGHHHDHGHNHDHEDEHEHEHDHEDQHKHEHDHDDETKLSYDPHIWSSPVQAKKQMKIIMEELSKKDPENAEYYKSNFEKYSTEFDKLDSEYRESLESLPNKKIVVSHEAYGYMTHEYGLTQMGIEGLIPESEPTPQRMAEIIDYVKENNVNTIFFEQSSGSKVAETIEKATGAKTKVLSTLESLTKEQIDNGDDYFSVMRQNLEALKEALK